MTYGKVKTAPVETFDDSTAVYEMRIKGLTYSHMEGEYGVFLMKGVQRRDFNWDEIEQAIGRSISPQMSDDLADVIRRYDLIDILVDRVK